MLHYSLKCYHFGMTAVKVFVKIIIIPDSDFFLPKLASDVPLHTFSKWYDIPVCFAFPLFEAVYCIIYGLHRVDVALFKKNDWWLVLFLIKYHEFEVDQQSVRLGCLVCIRVSWVCICSLNKREFIQLLYKVFLHEITVWIITSRYLIFLF